MNATLAPLSAPPRTLPRRPPLPPPRPRKPAVLPAISRGLARRRGPATDPATTAMPPGLRVALQLPSGLWHHLLAAALATQTGLVVTDHHPTVLLTAVQDCRADWDALAALCRVHAPVPVLVLGQKLPALAARALRLGAAGYLDRDATWEEMLRALHALHAGEMWADPTLALGLLRTALRSPAPPRSFLTPRESAVMQSLASGKRNKEIAADLDISETTVKSHLNRAYRKLQLGDRLQAALYVERHGLDAVV